jgi:hypothetical protein
MPHIREERMIHDRGYRAGQSIEDYCRACKSDRMHTVMAADSTGHPLRVVCDYCRSEHNYRGGPRVEPSSAPVRPRPDTTNETTAAAPEPRAGIRPAPVAESRADMKSSPSFQSTTMPPEASDLEQLLRRIIREETGLTPVAPAAKWRGGTLVLRPATPGLQEKTWPVETFFNKVVMLRNRLRTLEQQVNASELPDDVKLKLQGYITGCYGSLTSFNLLFADEADQFKGTGE